MKIDVGNIVEETVDDVLSHYMADEIVGKVSDRVVSDIVERGGMTYTNTITHIHKDSTIVQGLAVVGALSLLYLGYKAGSELVAYSKEREFFGRA